MFATDAFAQADDGVAALGLDLLARAAAVLPRAREARIAPGGFDPWREAFRVVQGYEVWQSYGAFVTTAKPNLGPGIKERIAYAATVTEQAAAGSARDRGGSPCAYPRAGATRDRGGAAGRALHRAAPRHAAGCARIVPRAGDAAHLHRGPCGFAAGRDPGRHRRRLPGRTSFIGWAGGDEALLDLACDLARFCGIVRA